MKKQKPQERRPPDLNAALRILENAKYTDPRLSSSDPDEKVQGVIDGLCDLSIRDGLTGLMNATFFHTVLTQELDRCQRTGRVCGLLVIDLDHFKQINDTFGHVIGDKVLRSVAAQLQHSTRSMDTAARIGGEEFAVILPECEPADAIHAAMRIHSGLNPLSVSIDAQNLRLTTSIGLVWSHPDMPVNSLVLLAEADQEMYRAKRSGRGRLCYRNMDITALSHQERAALMNLPFEESLNEN